MTLTEFLIARLDEDEAAARAAAHGPWTVGRSVRPRWAFVEQVDGGDITGGFALLDGNADHIARHDPARVLAEVDAKRRIVEEAAHWMYGDNDWSSDNPTMLEGIARLLALPYAEHPDYQQEWKP